MLKWMQRHDDYIIALDEMVESLDDPSQAEIEDRELIFDEEFLNMTRVEIRTELREREQYN